MVRGTHRRITLLGFAGVLGAVFFLTTLGVGLPAHPYGDLLAALSVGGAIVAAGLNGYWSGNVRVSMLITVLVAGGHLYATYLRAMQASRLPPVPARYYPLTIGLAIGVGISANAVGRLIATATEK